MKRHYIILSLILFVTFLFRFPSLFEPFWYGDEGIFAAVANNLNQGGVLYKDAWDNKPPMIYLTYAAIFKIFGVSMFWLRMVTVVVVLLTATIIYEITKIVLGQKRALVATFIFGFLTSLRVIEGNLALTEIFMILPISLAMLLAILRKFDYISIFGAGILLSIASLYKQVGALEATALGIYLFLISKNFGGVVKRGLVLTVGLTIPYLATIVYFAPKHLIGDYVFAAYTYYRIYLGESPRYAYLINILKFLPVIATILWGVYQKSKKRVNPLHLILLWAVFSFLGSFFSGRTYGHYLVQGAPAFSILVSTLSLKIILARSFGAFIIFFFLPFVILAKFVFTNYLSGDVFLGYQVGYWQNFVDYSFGRKSLDAYNDYFDKNVNRIMALADFFASRGEKNPKAYIWGDYPWLYAIANIENPSRYVTSFHVFGVPNGKEEVMRDLWKSPPDYIIKPPTSIGYFEQLENLLLKEYISFVKVESSEVYIKKGK